MNQQGYEIMFRNSTQPIPIKMITYSAQDMARVCAERDYLKQELFYLKNSGRIRAADLISAGEIIDCIGNNPKDALEIKLNPYIPFNIMTKLLGYIWMSGCWAGLAIVVASGVFGLSVVSLLFMMLSIGFVVISMVIYLDA